MCKLNILSKVNIKVAFAQLKKKKTLHWGKQLSEKGALKLDSKRARTCPRLLKSAKLPGYSSLPTSYLQQSQTMLVFVVYSLAMEVADTLVSIDEKTNTLNCAVWLVSFLIAIKWHFTISSFHSTFHSHFWKNPAVLRWPLGGAGVGRGMQCNCLQLRDVLRAAEQAPRPSNTHWITF